MLSSWKEASIFVSYIQCVFTYLALIQSLSLFNRRVNFGSHSSHKTITVVQCKVHLIKDVGKLPFHRWRFLIWYGVPHDLLIGSIGCSKQDSSFFDYNTTNVYYFSRHWSKHTWHKIRPYPGEFWSQAHGNRGECQRCPVTPGVQRKKPREVLRCAGRSERAPRPEGLGNELHARPL